MNWLRSKAKYCAGFGLLVIAFQLVLSFGHYHPVEANGDPSALSRLNDLAKASPTTVQTRSFLPGHEQDNSSDEVCVTCVTMALAHSALFTPPPHVAIPSSFTIVTRIEAAAVEPFSAPQLLFWSRGPPLS